MRYAPPVTSAVLGKGAVCAIKWRHGISRLKKWTPGKCVKMSWTLFLFEKHHDQPQKTQPLNCPHPPQRKPRSAQLTEQIKQQDCGAGRLDGFEQYMNAALYPRFGLLRE